MEGWAFECGCAELDRGIEDAASARAMIERALANDEMVVKRSTTVLCSRANLPASVPQSLNSPVCEAASRASIVIPPPTGLVTVCTHSQLS